MDTHNKTVQILKDISEKYELNNLKEILKDDDALLFKKDIFISLNNILNAKLADGDTLELLKEAKNIYDAPIFVIDPEKDIYKIENEPDFEKAGETLKRYSYCFDLSPYHIVNTLLAIVVAQVGGINLDELIDKGDEHVQASIAHSLHNNPNWDEETLKTDDPKLIMPVGAAGSGKSTFYNELSNVVNFSCDNMRYLLFKEYGPCFSAWESCLSWWVVNRLLDSYIREGYNTFYNGVNTDLEYRSPITMEDPDPLFAGMPYDVEIVYFEPPVELTDEELEELKSVNLWEKSIDDIDFNKYSYNVAKVLEMVRDNYKRTIARTEKINAGEVQQDPFDVQYAVPAPVVKLFVEQSFDKPQGDSVTVVRRKEIPDPVERSRFYKKYARKVMGE
ncbi:MAG: hypothetical protein ACQEQC_03115 [Elusimicrobiota bacterium]